MSATAHTIWDGYVPVANVVGGFATGFGVALALATIVVAVWQVFRSNNVARESYALETYREHLKLCVEHTEFSCYNLALKTLPGGTMKNVAFQESIQSERYLWFVSILLNACERIILTSPKDRVWKDTVEAQLSYHRGTLEEVWPTWKTHYSQQLRKIVDLLLKSEER